MNKKARRINEELRRSGGTRSARPGRGCPFLPSVVLTPLVLALVAARRRHRNRS